MAVYSLPSAALRCQMDSSSPKFSESSRRRDKSVVPSVRPFSQKVAATTMSMPATSELSAVAQSLAFSSSESELAARMLESQWALDFKDFLQSAEVDVVERSEAGGCPPEEEKAKEHRLQVKVRRKVKATGSIRQSGNQHRLSNRNTRASVDLDGGLDLTSSNSRRVRQEKSLAAEGHAVELAGHDLSASGTERKADDDELIRNYGADFTVDWNTKLASLSREEEWRLGEYIQSGKALSKALGQGASLEALSKQEGVSMRQLRRQQLLAQAAHNKIVQHNTALVLSIAHKYGAWRRSSDFSAVCHAGLQSLMTAAKDFNPRRRLRFSTFASLLISRAVRRAIAYTGFVRQPPLEQTDSGKNKYVNSRRRNLMRMPASLHESSQLGDRSWEECLASPNPGDGSLIHSASVISQAVQSTLRTLPSVEQVVLQRRFGLDGGGERALKEVGAELKLSAEMVRKYEARAVLKLKASSRMDVLAQELQSSF